MDHEKRQVCFDEELKLVPIADCADLLGLPIGRFKRWLKEVIDEFGGPIPHRGGYLTRPQLRQFMSRNEELALKKRTLRKERRARKLANAG